jgi:tetratricopeptide (TPR) repeat protein
MALQEALDEGNAFFRASDYTSALSSYSRAVSLAPSTNAKPLSNRAIVHLKLKDAAAALRDAEAAIRCDPVFTKAYSTKGSALELLGRREEAMEAYRQGLQVDPSNASLKENVTLLQARMNAPPPQPRRTPAAAQAAYGGGGGGGQADWFPVAPPLQPDDVTPVNSLRRGIQLCRLVLFMLFIAYLLPLRGNYSYLAFYALLLFSALVHSAELLLKYPPPTSTLSLSNLSGATELAKQWAFGDRSGFMKDSSLSPVFFPLIFFTVSKRPSVLAPVAVVLVDSWYSLEVITGLLPAMAQRFIEGLSNSISMRILNLDHDGLARLTSENRRKRILGVLLEYSAMAEVGSAILALLELFLPYRNFFLVMILWQSFVVRYPLSIHIRKAFKFVDQQILLLLNYPYVPSILKSLYEVQLKGFLSSYIPDPTRAEGAPPTSPLNDTVARVSGAARSAVDSVRNRCSIM